MKAYTVQLAQWRVCRDLGIPLLDTTVRSGDPVFMPGWGIVTGVKNGDITEDEYTSEYLTMMRESYKLNSSRWHEVMRMEKVAFACYCRTGAFCHRHLLIDIFAKLCRHEGVPFSYEGELKVDKSRKH